MENNLTIKTYMAIMAERDAAIRERNMALEERRRAFAERDMAMLQRDAAMSERNSAMEERDKALSALQYRESSMNENNISPDSPEHAIPHGGEKHMYHHQNHHHQQQQQMHYMPHMVESGYDPRDIGTGTSNPNPNPNPFQSQELACDETVKPKKAKQTKGSSTKKPTKGKRVHQEFTPVTGASSDDQENDLEFGHEGDDGLDGHMMVWKDNLGLNQINFDETTMPVPVCSCTGIPQPCYKWGNGGWQSACCTTTMSMYPLPQMSNKRHTRVGGRKMSGTVFSKLLNRLAAEGVDLYAPLDLKDYWAKHGTNRYSTLK